MKQLIKLERDCYESLEKLSKTNGFCFDLLLDFLKKRYHYLNEYNKNRC
ncbi:hypothetical protein SAMN04487898_105170 [Pedobacter sp. ok626]|nr:hypothetical protein SAMN04487898_105170 [Pedobacter sp. ok626]